MSGLTTTTHDEDLAQLQAFEQAPPPTVIVTSDLHLGEGLNPLDGRTVKTENFVQDGAFSRMVDYHIDRLSGSGQQALMVLNGDIVDFPRITTVPRGAEALEQWRALLLSVGRDMSTDELERSISSKEERFGLRTNDFKVVWKLDRVVRGHRVFFKALARWVAAGHHLMYVKGNHDLEIEHPLVRRAFRHAILSAADEDDATALSPEDAMGRIAFCMHGVELANAWIEHGHQFEAMTRVVGPAFLTSRPGEINQPVGTFINRYLLNPIEHMRPFLNNIKPVEGVLWKLLKHHPVKALGAVFRASWFVPRALAMARIRQLLGVLMFLLFVIGGWVVGIGLTVALLGLATGAWHPFGDGSLRAIAIIALCALGAPVAIGAARDLLSRFRRHRVSPYVADCVAAAPQTVTRSSYEVAYVVVGHTHEQDSQRFVWEEPGVTPIMYLNTGTWIPIWSDDRPDLHGRSLRPFVQLTLGDGVYHHAHLQWNDGRGEPEPSVVLAGLL